MSHHSLNSNKLKKVGYLIQRNYIIKIIKSEAYIQEKFQNLRSIRWTKQMELMGTQKGKIKQGEKVMKRER